MPTTIDPQVDATNASAVLNYNQALAFETTFFPLLAGGNGEANTVQKVRAAIQLYYISGATQKATQLSADAIASATSIGVAEELLALLQTALADVIASLAAAAAPPVPAPSADPASGGAAAVSVAHEAVDAALDTLNQAKNALLQAAVELGAIQGG